MLRVLTGRLPLLEGQLIAEARRVLEETEKSLLVVVPKRLTLETELKLLGGLGLRGSFRLQVLSPERLCGRIFEAAGAPEGERIDARGRVMLIRRALISLKGRLTAYRGAENRRGFAQRCMQDLEILRQAAVTPEELREAAEGFSGSLANKIGDLAEILQAYENALAGRYQDGESELFEATARVRDATFLSECEICFYGFDMTPPTVNRLMGALAAVCPVSALIPLPNDRRARDYDLFHPLEASVRRLLLAAREANALAERVAVDEAEDFRHPELRYLTKELFAFPCRPWEGGVPRAVQLLQARNPQQEALYAAALCRRLARQRHWKWNDMRILCFGLEDYHQALEEAFREYEIPLFLSSSRPASRHALTESLLGALTLLVYNFRTEDALALIGTGFLDIEPDEADRLRNYAVQYGLAGQAFLRPLRRGLQEVVEALEPIRERAFRPVANLRAALREAENLPAQLAALFGFLTDIRAYERSLQKQEEFKALDLRREAGEQAQVWNRVLGTLDQMHAILGERKLPLGELLALLQESLDAAVIKPLPQSGDAVFAQEAERISMQATRAVIVLGASDRAAGAPGGLLNLQQKLRLSEKTRKYLGPDVSDAARSDMYSIKCALAMATEYVMISFPLNGADDQALQPSGMVEQIREIFPALHFRGGLAEDLSLSRMLMESSSAAIKGLSGRLLEAGQVEREALRALKDLPQAGEALARLRSALRLPEEAERLRPGTARELYGKLRRASVTRLESFARCPFQHFAQYGLQPLVVDPYQLTPRDEGLFFHDAVRSFLADALDKDGHIDPDRAQSRMDEISSALLGALREGPLGQTATSLAEERRLRGVARTAARVLAEHLQDSLFRPVELEMRFQEGRGELLVAGDCVLEGTIDRVDEWTDGEDTYLRVIDYKRSARALEMCEIYCGLQLQLLTYLATALRRRGGKSAGVFYFRMDEGILSTQETDPQKIEAERMRSLRMDGLAPNDARLLSAMAPQFDRVLRLRRNQDGSVGKQGNCTDQQGFEKLIGHTLRMAGAHVRDIRGGKAAPAPVRTPSSDACEFCRWKSACLNDPKVHAERLRKIDKMSLPQVLAAIEGFVKIDD
ncbi:MAG TPA: PD-(D/E)XK nuclease family protein [Candidatus Pullichristensenella excrementigallinarum]|uniref:PD-(D/E)XK nuclease family protein n=1 Tax=Candidatus Pullichristensenella excrementigallinarum TaxID=2840907 RepID=A0A9D1LCA6_9FIRM|nr:PD-(D/E)XK nuclease family protein [Candidatus Pullichristensenella excrementigallinarum]